MFFKGAHFEHGKKDEPKKQVRQNAINVSLSSPSLGRAPRDKQAPRERSPRRHAIPANLPVCRQPLAHLPRAAVRAAVQPAVGVDCDGMPRISRHMLLACDVPQRREEALDSHVGGGGRERAPAVSLSPS